MRIKDFFRLWKLRKNPKASQLASYYCISVRLAELLILANQETLATIYNTICGELKKRAVLPSTRELASDCLEDVANDTEGRLFKVKEINYNARRKKGKDTPQLENDDMIIEACWALATREGLLDKVDGSLYQIGGFETQDRTQIFDLALNHTLGWSSDEYGEGFK